ncbi:hypothetical protein KIW84_020499 [Lathyrus oleraceus]|uniref:Uncharacterized protein n=1 Tax=Pisum sativum TaxID=3888 RepID=A0A9D5B470_PEA|nr:hypothetical protein KIW84_020499 [Pisum sativum]
MLNAGRYQNNNIDDATTQPMVPFSFSSNNPFSFLTPARYGRTLPLSPINNPFVPSYLPNSSQIPSSSLGNTPLIPYFLPNSSRISSLRSGNTPLIPSNIPNSSRFSSSILRNTSLIISYPHNASHNSSSNGVTTRYQNPPRPILHNQMNFRYSPYCEGSNHTNNTNPLVLNDFNPRARIGLNRYQGLEDIVIHNANPNNNNNIPLLLNDSNPRSRMDFYNYQGHGNASSDSTMEHHVINIEEASSRREQVTTSDVSFNETQTQKKELLLFKDDKNRVPTRPMIEIDDSNDDEHLDLSLRL